MSERKPNRDPRPLAHGELQRALDQAERDIAKGHRVKQTKIAEKLSRWACSDGKLEDE